ncbi:MAG: DUF2071 domain-containing protein [Cryobacterium sp.]|nr:DUF2071 domain-containing protein [Cryobacterium sp.]
MPFLSPPELRQPALHTSRGRTVTVVRLPQMAGDIERRLLVNYRVEPAALTGLLPAQLRPQLVDGLAVAGICLIRLGTLRPRGLLPF